MYCSVKKKGYVYKLCRKWHSMEKAQVQKKHRYSVTSFDEMPSYFTPQGCTIAVIQTWLRQFMLLPSGEGNYFLKVQFFFLLILSWLNMVWYSFAWILESFRQQTGHFARALGFRTCIIFKVAASGLMRKTGEVPATHWIAVLLSTSPFQNCKFPSCMLESSVSLLCKLHSRQVSVLRLKCQWAMCKLTTETAAMADYK